IAAAGGRRRAPGVVDHRLGAIGGLRPARGNGRLRDDRSGPLPHGGARPRQRPMTDPTVPEPARRRAAVPAEEGAAAPAGSSVPPLREADPVFWVLLLVMIMPLLATIMAMVGHGWVPTADDAWVAR